MISWVTLCLSPEDIEVCTAKELAETILTEKLAEERKILLMCNFYGKEFKLLVSESSYSFTFLKDGFHFPP